MNYFHYFTISLVLRLLTIIFQFWSVDSRLDDCLLTRIEKLWSVGEVLKDQSLFEDLKAFNLPLLEESSPGRTPFIKNLSLLISGVFSIDLSPL